MEKKTIKLNKDTYKELTFEEILNIYRVLINSYVTKFQAIYPQFLLEYEDLYQIFSMSLYKAYRLYDVSREVGFGLVAKKYLTFKSMNIYRENIMEKRNNKQYHEESIDNWHSLVDIETMESRFNVIIIKDYVDKLSPIDKTIVYETYKNGCRIKKKLRSKVGISRVSINKRLKKHKEILKEMLLEGGVKI